MSNLSIKVNLMRVPGASLLKLKGKTAVKECVVIPVEDSGLFVAEKYAESLQLCKADVSGCYIERICDSCNTGYIPELYRDSDGKQATVTFQDCPNCGKRDDIWVKIHADNNR